MPIFNNPQIDTTANPGPSIWTTIMSALQAGQGGLQAGLGAIPQTTPSPMAAPAPIAAPSPGLGGGAPTGGATPALRPQAPTLAMPRALTPPEGAAGDIVGALGNPQATMGMPPSAGGLTGIADTIKRMLGDKKPGTLGPNVAGLGVTGAEGGPGVGPPTGAEVETPSLGLGPGWGKLSGPEPAAQTPDWLTGSTVEQPTPPAAMDPSQAAPAGTGGQSTAGTGGGKTGGGASSFSIPGPQQQTYWDIVNRAEGTGINTRSTAFGPGQFIDSTFRDYLKAVHPELGDASKMNHALLNEYKNKYGQDATTWYAGENAKKLAHANIPVDNATLYGAHFLGPEGAIKLLSATDNTPVAMVLDPKQIEANPEALSGKTVGEVKAWLQSKTHILPQQPGLTAAPQKAQTPPTDFSTVRQLLAQTNVSPNEHMANVLAGLAGGAASVAPNAPGSFASALAATGAGGAKGFAKGYEAQRAAMATRAEAEMRMLSTSHAEAKEAAEIAYQNAASNWKVTNENADRQYQGNLKERELLQPKVEMNGGVLSVTRYNPTTGNYDVQTHNVKSTVDQMDTVMKMLKGTGAEGPVAEAQAVNTVINMYKDQPEVARKMIMAFAVKQMIANSAGKAVFGAPYDALQKSAKAEIDAELGSQAIATMKPLDYQAAINDRVVAKLLAHPGIEEKGWLERAAQQGSVAARMLAGKPTLTPTAAPPDKAQERVSGY